MEITHRLNTEVGKALASSDLRDKESVLKILGPGQQLAVDANGRFDLATSVDYGRALSQYPLFWYEEAGDPLDSSWGGKSHAPSPCS